MRIYRSIRWRRFFLFITSFLICSPLAFASTLKEKSNLNREKEAIYIEDFTQEPVILNAKKQVPIYLSPQRKRSIGQLRKGKSQRNSNIEGPIFIKGMALHGQVKGWITELALEELDKSFSDNLRQLHKRKNCR